MARGRTDPAFEAAAFALGAPGDRAPIVHTRFGYHLIELVEKPGAVRLPFERVAARIRQHLAREALERFREGRRNAARVERNLARFDALMDAPGKPASSSAGASR